MDYVCENVKRIVIYEQNTISVTLERCNACIGCLRSKVEPPSCSYVAIAEIEKILERPGFEKTRIIIEGMTEK